MLAVKQKGTGASWAMKKVTLDPGAGIDITSLRTEIQVQQKLDHPNICRVTESYEEEASGTVFIMMELVRSCTHAHAACTSAGTR